MPGSLKIIAAEAKAHAPFTILGAASGIAFMLVFQNLGDSARHTLFSVFHPAHVVLSAMITAAMFRRHTNAKNNLLKIVLIGYVGSIGVATLSDIVLPHLGLDALGLAVPTHAEVHHSHEHSHDHDHQHGPDCDHSHGGFHLGFIEEWYLVTPAALLGIAMAFALPKTRLPHAGHVLVSTWASSAYMMMENSLVFSPAVVISVIVILFAAVWLPCCLSDIVFPLLFLNKDARAAQSRNCPLCSEKVTEKNHEPE